MSPVTRRPLPFYTDTPVTWRIEPGLTDYDHAVAFMQQRVANILAGVAPELVWLVEHPPLYTAGTSAREEDLRAPDQFPVYQTKRGGQYTYHGPGQRVAYLMLDLNRRKKDVRAFVSAVEAWLKQALTSFNVDAFTTPERVGLWVDRTQPGGRQREDKIAAIGIKLTRWVSWHGIALNVEPELSHFGGIVPCGISDERYGVTSLVDLGLPVTMDDVDGALQDAFHAVFGPTQPPRTCAGGPKRASGG